MAYARRVTRAARRVLIVVPLLLTGCMSLNSGAIQRIPADAVELSFYMRNSSRLPYYYILRGEHQPQMEGPVQERPASAGCGLVGRDWELLVWQAPSRPDPAAEEAHRTSGEAFRDPDELSLWLSVAPDGSVTSGEGVPEWWGDRDVQRCP